MRSCSGCYTSRSRARSRRASRSSGGSCSTTRPLPRGTAGWRAIPVARATRLLFNRMPKSPTIELPIHVDVNVPDREAELARVLELGGRLVETKSHSVGDLEEAWTVMRDPEGNGFCIQSPPNALPHRYIGNVT